MYITHCEQENGDYVDANGVRFAVTVITHPTKYAREHMTPYESLEAALTEWGLTYDPLPRPEPQAEN